MDVEHVKEAEILCHKKQQFFKNYSLPAKMVSENVKDTAGDKECQLKEKCTHFMVY